jgi:hypothetical protein
MTVILSEAFAKLDAVKGLAFPPALAVMLIVL